MLPKLDNLGVREKAFIVAAGICLFVLLVDGLVVQPVFRRLQALRASIDSVSVSLAYDRAVLLQEPQVLERYEGMKGLLGEATAPPDVMVSDMKGKIDEIARRVGLLVVSMEHREPRKTEHYGEYYVEVGEFEAPSESLFRFLHAVRSSPGMLRTVKLTVLPHKDEGSVKGAMLIAKTMAVPAEGAEENP